MDKQKARAIFTNDAECDDMNTLVHLLLYTNDIDLEGIVLSSSIYHYGGDEARGIEPYRWAGGQWMWDYLDDYESVYANLLVHDPSYPTPDYLRSVTCIGNIKTTGDMDEDTDGSELIRHAVFSDDERPIWLLAGGGTNTIGRALKHVEDEYRGTEQWQSVYEQVCAKTIIYMIITQDDTYRDYISKSWPDLPILHCTNIRGIAFKFNEERDPADALRTLKGTWLKPYVLDQGPLCANYHTWFDGHVYPGERDEYQYGAHPELIGGKWNGLPSPDQYDMISEGDSPAFFHLIDKGLQSVEHPEWGGWGGRFERVDEGEFGSLPAYWQNAVDDDHGPTAGYAYQITRWLADAMNDFACRAAWCVTPRHEDANHVPELAVREGNEVTACAGDALVLHAEGSDPDGDALFFDWQRYHELDSYSGELGLEQTSDGALRLEIPADARPGDTIHLVARVRDRAADGDEPYMVAYQRVLVRVAA